MNNYNPASAQKLNSLSALSINIPEAITYQFQVVEYMKDGKVAKVEMQVQATTHDSYGNIASSSGFVAVPRIQLPLIDHK